jgi:predicted dehydrogenase
MSKLRWGIIGTGSIAHHFARGVLRSQTGDLVAVASRSDSKARDFARVYQLPHAHGSYEALLADSDVDVVYIATPHPQHREWTVRAAQAKKHILCEKPLGVHHDEAVEMLQAAWENNVFFMEAYMYRCHPQITRMLELLRSGAIGEIRTISARFGFFAEYDLEGRLFNQTLGGGGILDVGGYCTSMARLIAGASTGAVAEPERVFGVGQIGPESGVDEFASALLLFPGGIVANLSCGLRLDQDNEVRVEGTLGSLILRTPWVASVDGGDAQIILQKNGQAHETINVPSGPIYSLEADLVGHHIAQGNREAAWPAMTWTDTLGNIRTQDKWRRAIDAVAPSFAEPPGTKTQPVTFATWEQRFSKLFHAAVDNYRSGHEKASGIVDDKGRKFLGSIGCTEQEFFDFVEDFARGGEPSLETAVQIASVRRDYFLKVQNGAQSLSRIATSNLPSKDAEINGIGWLPRLLPKAEAKLRGEMPPDLMYGCGGDRKFFRTHQIDPAEFLQKVWHARGNYAQVIEWVKNESKAQSNS